MKLRLYFGILLLAIVFSGQLSPLVLAQDEESSLGDPITLENIEQVTQLRMLGRGELRQLALSPNNQLLAVASSVGIWLYDWTQLQTEPTLITVENAGAYSVVFSPDGSRIAVGLSDGTARVWDVTTRTQLVSVQVVGNVILDAQFSPDGTQIVTAAHERVVRVWDAATGEQIRVIGGYSNYNDVRRALYSPDGSRILTTSEEGAIRVWDSSTGELLQGRRCSSLGVAYSPDGSQIVCGGFVGQELQIVSAADLGNIFHTLREYDEPQGGGGDISSVDYSPDGSRVLAASWDGSLQIWNSQNGELALTIPGNSYSLRSAVFSSEGTQVITASAQGKIRVWNAVSGQFLFELDGYVDSVLDADYSPDGTQIAVLSFPQTLTFWSTSTNESLGTYFFSRQSLPSHFDYSPDGSSVAIPVDSEVVIIDVRTRTPLQHFDVAVRSGTLDFDFSPDGNYIAIASEYLQIWNAIDGEEVFRINAPNMSASYSPDGRYIVSIYPADQQLPRIVRVWDAITGVPVQDFVVSEPHPYSGDLYQASYNWDGSRILSSAYDRRVRVWDVHTGQELYVIHPALVGAFSPDDRLIVTGGQNGLQVWDASTGNLIHTISSYSRADNIRFRPDGSQFITSSFDGTVRIWGLSSMDSP